MVAKLILRKKERINNPVAAFSEHNRSETKTSIIMSDHPPRAGAGPYASGTAAEEADRHYLSESQTQTQAQAGCAQQHQEYHQAAASQQQQQFQKTYEKEIEREEESKEGWISFVDTIAKSRRIHTSQDAAQEENSEQRVQIQELAHSKGKPKAGGGGVIPGYSGSSKRKRSISEAEGDVDGSDEDSYGDEEGEAATSPPARKGQKRNKEEIRKARAERKRCREKQRRSNVNKGYDDLTELLVKIDAADSGANASAIEEGCKASDGGVLPSDAPQNRVDLIARTVQVMDRLFQENTELKKRFKKGGHSLGDGEGLSNKIKGAGYAPVSDRISSVSDGGLPPPRSMPGNAYGDQGVSSCSNGLRSAFSFDNKLTPFASSVSSRAARHDLCASNGAMGK
jgi:hypothetical protein